VCGQNTKLEKLRNELFFFFELLRFRIFLSEQNFRNDSVFVSLGKF
jgi:hypothetical protein